MLDAVKWVQNEGEARQFLVFHYLRQYHRAIWRLLERQPETLQLLTAVLVQTGSLEPLDLKDIEEKDQRLLREFFSRAFSHVLADTSETEEQERFHRRQDIDAAIQAFTERQDRKRSDEHLRKLFAELIPAQTNLPQRYLIV
jgi:hypothetical protein